MALQKQALQLAKAALLIDPRAKQIFEALGISDSIDVNFELKKFNTHDDIEGYLNSGEYESDDDHKGMCFGFSVTEISNSEVDVRLAFSG